MYKILVLFLLTLSHCHLSNVSASDFPDFFSSGVNTYATLDSYTIDNNDLSYKISVYHKYGIQKVVVSGATSGEENSTVVKDGVTSSTVKNTIALNADDNPKHTIYVSIYPMTGDEVVLSFTITATI